MTTKEAVMRKLGLILAAMALVAGGVWAAAAMAGVHGAAPGSTGTGTTHVVVPVQRLTGVHSATAVHRTAVHHKAASEAESPGEPAGDENGDENGAPEHDTHADPAGQNVDHQCPPDCDTAHGEQP
jgi:hypothetical protein